MIYTDGVHLISDKSLDELHVFAKKIRLRRNWFQAGRHGHYDLTTRAAYDRAINAGAIRTSSRNLVIIMREGFRRGDL